MPPPAPPLFSTTTLRASFSARCAASGRAAKSAVPPGGNGTTMVIVRAGQASCACRRSGARSAGTSGSPADIVSNARRLIMAVPPDGRHLLERVHFGWKDPPFPVGPPPPWPVEDGRKRPDGG